MDTFNASCFVRLDWCVRNERLNLAAGYPLDLLEVLNRVSGVDSCSRNRWEPRPTSFSDAKISYRGSGRAVLAAWSRAESVGIQHTYSWWCSRRWCFSTHYNYTFVASLGGGLLHPSAMRWKWRRSLSGVSYNFHWWTFPGRSQWSSHYSILSSSVTVNVYLSSVGRCQRWFRHLLMKIGVPQMRLFFVGPSKYVRAQQISDYDER